LSHSLEIQFEASGGNAELPINPLSLAIVSGATYVTRGFSGDTRQLTDLCAGAIAHRGFFSSPLSSRYGLSHYSEKTGGW